MMTVETEPAALRIATDAASDLLGFEYNTIRRHDPDTDQLVPVAMSETLIESTGDRRSYDRGESVQFEAIDADSCLVFPDVTSVDDAVERPGGGSMIVVPINGYGVMSLGSGETQTITQTDIELAEMLGATVEAALDRVSKLNTLEEREASLAHKTERLDTLVSKAAHELRNSITVLMNRVDLARRTGDATHLRDLQQSVERMERLVDDIILVSQMEMDELSEDLPRVELAALIRECWASVQTETATLNTRLTDAVVSADPTRVGQLLDNLFRNAVQHGGSDVTVTVGRLGAESAPDPDPAPDSPAAPPADGHGAGGEAGDRQSEPEPKPELASGFYVADDGRGIDPAVNDQPLKPGVKRTDNWTGSIGLEVVSEVAELHGWSVRITESVDGGVRVEIAGVEWDRSEGSSVENAAVDNE